MKKLLTFALLSLGAFCLYPGKASAWLGDPYGHWWCREVCTWPYVPIKVPKYRSPSDPSGRGQWFGGSRGQCCGGYPAPYFMKPYNAFSLPSFGSFGDPGCGYPPPCGGPYGGSGGQPMIILNMSCPPNYSPPNDGPYGRMGRQPGFCPPNYCPPVYGDTANCGPMSSGPICYETVCPPSCIPSCDPSSLYSPMGQGRVIVLNPNGGGLPTQLPAAGTMLAIPASMRSGGASVLQLPPVQPSGSTPLPVSSTYAPSGTPHLSPVPSDSQARTSNVPGMLEVVGYQPMYYPTTTYYPPSRQNGAMPAANPVGYYGGR